MSNEPCGFCSGNDSECYCPRCAFTTVSPTGTITHHRTWYCNPLCRSLGEEAHASTCNELYTSQILREADRAANIAQALFYLYIEKTWVYDMESAKFKKFGNDELVQLEVEEGEGENKGPGGQSSNKRCGGGWLVEFPQTWFKEEDKYARAALLADGNSLWQFVAMHIVVKLLFENLVNDIQTDIKEIHYIRAPHIHKIIAYTTPFSTPTTRPDQPYKDNPQDTGVFEVTLKSGQKIALDLSGAQFHTKFSHKTIRPWQEFWQLYGADIVQRNDFGTSCSNHVLLLSSFSTLTHLSVGMYLLEHFSTWLTDIDCGAYNGPNGPVSNLSPSGHRLSLFQHLPLIFDPRKFVANQENILTAAQILLGKRIHSVDTGTAVLNTQFRYPVHPTHGLRHPATFIRTSIFQLAPRGKELVLPSVGPELGDFHWGIIKDIAKAPGVKLDERRDAREMLDMRCLVRPFGNEQMLFLKGVVPGREVRDGKEVEVESSENPHWKGRTVERLI